MKPSLPCARLLLSSILLPSAAACALGVELPVELSSSPVVLDADAERTALEERICADAASFSCGVLAAIDASDDGVAEPLPRFPALIPTRVDGVDPALGGRAAVDVVDWLEEERRQRDLLPFAVLPFAWAGTEAEGFLGSIDDLTLHGAEVDFRGSSTTFDAPPFEIWIAAGSLEEGVDPRALVERGEAERIGRIPGLPAGSEEVVPVSLVEGGTERLRRSLREGAVTLLVGVDPSTPIPLPPGELPETLRRPEGRLEVVFRMTALVGVSAVELARAAR